MFTREFSFNTVVTVKRILSIRIFIFFYPYTAFPRRKFYVLDALRDILRIHWPCCSEYIWGKRINLNCALAIIDLDALDNFCLCITQMDNCQVITILVSALLEMERHCHIAIFRLHFLAVIDK